MMGSSMVAAEASPMGRMAWSTRLRASPPGIHCRNNTLRWRQWQWQWCVLRSRGVEEGEGEGEEGRTCEQYNLVAAAAW
jgi:hypothetical protein